VMRSLIPNIPRGRLLLHLTSSMPLSDKAALSTASADKEFGLVHPKTNLDMEGPPGEGEKGDPFSTHTQLLFDKERVNDEIEL
jgi:hypothetical protein